MDLKQIKENLDKRMGVILAKHSAAPTPAEVEIAWLVCEVDRLNEILNIGTNPKGGEEYARAKIQS